MGIYEVLLGVALIMGCAIPAALMLWLVVHVVLRRAAAIAHDETPPSGDKASHDPARASHAPEETSHVPEGTSHVPGQASDGPGGRSPVPGGPADNEQGSPGLVKGE